MADKFLESMELEEIVEDISMTRLGQMLVDRGMRTGLQQGLEQKLETQICKKLAKGKTIEVIAEELEEDPETIKMILQKITESAEQK